MVKLRAYTVAERVTRYNKHLHFPSPFLTYTP